MNKELIPHVFASLQSLERYLREARARATGMNDSMSPTLRTIPQLEATVKKMRRVANRLQLQVAAEDSPEIVRSLRIFYGLNHLVRPEILRLVLEVTKGPSFASAARPEPSLASASLH